MKKVLLATCAVLALSAGGAIGQSAFAANTQTTTSSSTGNAAQAQRR